MPEKSKEIWFRYRGKWPFIYPWPVHWKGCAFQLFPFVFLWVLINYLPFKIAGIVVITMVIVGNILFYVFMREHSEPDND